MINEEIQKLYSLEELSSLKSPIHSLHPFVKLLASLVYIVCVISFDRWTFTRLIPYLCYPILIMAISGIPWSTIFRRFLPVLPFVAFAGISNVIFDREIMYTIGSLGLSGGVVSFAVLIFRAFLCVAAVLILIGVTSFSDITSELRRMHIPHVLVSVLEMAYRYIAVLVEESTNMSNAYKLRSNSKGVSIKHTGSFIGQLLIRSYDKANRIFGAMKCRHYPSRATSFAERPLNGRDLTFLAAIAFPSILLRVFEIKL